MAMWDVFHEKFQPLTPGFVSIEPTPEALAAALDTYKVAAVLFEIVRGEGGVLPLVEDVETIMAQIPEGHQTALFSATMPEAIRRITRRFMKEPPN